MNENFIKESIVKIENQNIMSITGVEKVISFSPTQVILFAMGNEVAIQGTNLETTKLDDKTRELFVNGLILSIKWQTKKEKLPFYKRLFKWFYLKHSLSQKFFCALQLLVFWVELFLIFAILYPFFAMITKLWKEFYNFYRPCFVFLFCFW